MGSPRRTAPSPSSTDRILDSAAGVAGDFPVGTPARRGSERAAGIGPDREAAGGSNSRTAERRGRKGTSARGGATSSARTSRSQVAPASPGKAGAQTDDVRAVGRSERRRPVSLSVVQESSAAEGERGRPAYRWLAVPRMPEEMRRVEGSSAEEGELEEDVGDAVGEVGPAAGGVPGPMQPGECNAALLPFLSPSLLSGMGAQGQAGGTAGISGTDVLTREVLQGLKELLQRLGSGGVPGGGGCCGGHFSETGRAGGQPPEWRGYGGEAAGKK